MRIQNPLKEKIQRLKIGGSPLIIGTFNERSDCFNLAGRLDYQISSRKKLDGNGWEIRRTK